MVKGYQIVDFSRLKCKLISYECDCFGGKSWNQSWHTPIKYLQFTKFRCFSHCKQNLDRPPLSNGITLAPSKGSLVSESTTSPFSVTLSVFPWGVFSWQLLKLSPLASLQQKRGKKVHIDY